MLLDSVDLIARYLINYMNRYVGSMPYTAAIQPAAINATAITSVTPQTVIAATSGKTVYLKSVQIYNTTTGTPVITLADTSGSPVTVFVGVPGASYAGIINQNFDPPLPLTAGYGLTGQAGSTAGNTFVLATYFLG